MSNELPEYARTDPRNAHPMFEAPEQVIIIEVLGTENAEVHGRWPSVDTSEARITLKLAEGVALHGHPGAIARLCADGMIQARGAERRAESDALFLVDGQIQTSPAPAPEQLVDPFTGGASPVGPKIDLSGWSSRTEGGAEL